MTDDIVKRATEALEGVTPGPWIAGPHQNDETAQMFWYVYARCIIFEVDGSYDEDDDDVVATRLGRDAKAIQADARFIAAARDLVPDMAAEIAALRAEVEKLTKAKQLANARADAAERQARRWRDVADTALAELFELSGVAKP